MGDSASDYDALGGSVQDDSSSDDSVLGGNAPDDSAPDHSATDGRVWATDASINDGERQLASGAPARQTSPEAIRSFRRSYGLSLEELAILLDVEPETLQRFEDEGMAPAWMAYALLGLGYELFGVAQDDAGEPDGAGEAG